MKSSKLIMGCLATLGLTAGIAVAQDDAERDAIAERLKPVGELCLQGEDCGTAMAASGGGDSDASGGGGGSVDGEGIYNNVCMACHETGAAGAPVRGDEAAWADRVSKGFETLLDHSTNGFNAMPARGGNPNVTDEEMLAVTKYMLEPVMDVPEQEGGEAPAQKEEAAAGEADEASDDQATASSDEEAAAAEDTAAGGDDASTEGEAQTEEQAVASDSSADADETQQDAAQDAAEPGADGEQGAATEVAAADGSASGGADLPGADKIGTCVACHGQDGHGTAPMYPNLAGQNAVYMENALKAYRAGERKGGMSAVMTPMAASLSDEDITDIAAYYSQQTP